MSCPVFFWSFILGLHHFSDWYNLRNGFLKFLADARPDVLCYQKMLLEKDRDCSLVHNPYLLLL